jgi:saposin
MLSKSAATELKPPKVYHVSVNPRTLNRIDGRSPLGQLVPSTKSIRNTAECSLCKYVLQYVNVLITNNSTEKEVEKALEAVCSILPSQYHSQCSSFVKQYGPVLVELIAELDDPNVVCQWIGVCAKSNANAMEIAALKRQPNSLPCNLCQYVVNYLDIIVQSNATEAKFEELLDNACKLLPEKKLQAECRIIATMYDPDLIQWLVQYGDPKAVCQAAGICDK